ncbi:CoA transferase [Actinosynnema sp. NPDC050436]|uniref:CoA transferase n=1 Tax=Actinosynnema sp. NPDC050436 TaxID=3155659 RepID=UPI0033FC2822
MTGRKTACFAALDGATAAVSGSSAAAQVLREHLAALGAEVTAGDDHGRIGGSQRSSLQHDREDLLGTGRGGPFDDTAAHAVLSLPTGRHSVVVDWAGPVDVPGLRDEATAQAACGVMHVHGRRSGAPRGPAVDYCGTAAGVLATTGLLASVLRHPDGEHEVRTSVAEAALLTVSQYLAAAGAAEGEAVDLTPGGPPFTSADGVRFEVEALVPEVWAAFWTALDADRAAVGAGWRPYQFRYATATAPLPDALHAAARAAPFARITAAGAASGASTCAVRPAADLPADVVPWRLTPTTGTHTTGTHTTGAAPDPLLGNEFATPDPWRVSPTGLDGLVVWEAGRRIQAPLAAHLLGLLGARVVRVEPPGGDPLRGMPPTSGGVSARWLALNRNKESVEVDLKDPADRRRLRAALAPADVFLHNWAPGNAERWGLAAADLPAGLVHAYTSGWGGATDADLPVGTDFMVQARTGLADLVRAADEAPAPSLMTLVDVLGGLVGAEAVLAGLLTRRATGRGVAVESSLLGAAALLGRTAPARRPAGFRAPVDGLVCGVPVTDDLAALPNDPRFAAVLGRDDRGCPVLGSPWRFR